MSGRGTADSDDTEGNTFVQAAHPITLRIDRDVLIPDRAQLAHQSLADAGLERPGQLVAADLEPSEGGRLAVGDTEIVVPDAAHAEPHRADGLFRAFDHSQLFGSHFGVIRNARREAG